MDFFLQKCVFLCRLHKMTLKLKSTRPAAGLPANNRARVFEDGTV